MKTVEEICAYLTPAKELETTLYTQKMLLKGIKERIDSIDTNERKTYSGYDLEPYNIIMHIALTIIKSLIIGAIVPVAVYLIWIIYVIISPNLTTWGIMIRNIIFAIVATIIITIIITNKEIKDIINKRNREVIAHKNSMERVIIEKEEERVRLKEANKKKEFLTLQYNEILETMKKTEEVRKEYYKDSFIFPKYLNMLAINQILEYLQSGRCDSLTGPDGAYNLFENELRLNKIIGRLDIVIDQLEEIKNIQYMIYEELTKVNKNLNDILGELDYNSKQLDNIAVSSSIAAYNSQVTAYNTSLALSC